MIENANFEPQLNDMLSSQKRSSVLLTIGLYKKLYSYYHYNLYFINKNFVEISFLFYYISTDIVASIFPVDQQILKYLVPGSLQKKFANFHCSQLFFKFE